MDRAPVAELDPHTPELAALSASSPPSAIPTWRGPHPAATTRYDLRLTSDGTVVLVKAAGAGTCGLRPGDVVETIEGRPALEQIGFQGEARLLSLALPALQAIATEARLEPGEQIALVLAA